MEGVLRPLAANGFFADTGMLGPRECRGARPWYKPGRGVADGSRAIEVFRPGIGVLGIGFAVIEASDSGGEGGVASGSGVSGFVCGGVEAVGDESVVTEVDASDAGERGRNASPARAFDVLR
jgi:hypothetical protein